MIVNMTPLNYLPKARQAFAAYFAGMDTDHMCAESIQLKEYMQIMIELMDGVISEPN
jgi:hypothetical protein